MYTSKIFYIDTQSQSQSLMYDKFVDFNTNHIKFEWYLVDCIKQFHNRYLTFKINFHLAFAK